MKTLVVGLGTQGSKRSKILGNDYVGSVDPLNKKADYKFIEDVPLNLYDSVLACTPDDPKLKILKYCLKNKKNVLVEKPLLTNKDKDLFELQRIARKNNVVCYTAYNHRFEPHFVKMQKIIRSGFLGKIYSCRMFYGNGTARIVKNSIWRDQGLGVLPDLGSHLLDTCLFWFGNKLSDFKLISANRFENLSPDHIIFFNNNKNWRIELEITLCMWKNNFFCDIIGEKGSAHISSLCKWGPSKFILRKRVFPSGIPKESKFILRQKDPTWKKEYIFFKKLIFNNHKTNLSNDIWIQNQIKKIGKSIRKN